MAGNGHPSQQLEKGADYSHFGENHGTEELALQILSGDCVGTNVSQNSLNHTVRMAVFNNGTLYFYQVYSDDDSTET